jgi:hypothetical protein
VRAAAAAVAFLAGGYVATHVLAALYGFLDLFGRLRTAWPGLLGRFAGWSLAAGVVAALLGPDHRRAFAWGLASLVAWYLAAAALRHLLVRPMPRLPLPPR